MALPGENGWCQTTTQAEEGRSLDRLSELLGHQIQFRYTAWDRIVLNGYLDRLQRPENIVYFFREVVGAPCVTPEVLMSRTAPYRAWVTRCAQDGGIPLLPRLRGSGRRTWPCPTTAGSRRPKVLSAS